jgi:hypothetical protein
MRLGLAFVVAAAVALGLLCGASPGLATITTPYSAQGNFLLTSGVTYEWGTIAVEQKLRDVDVVAVDPANPHLDLRLALAGDSASSTSTVTDQALAYSQVGRRVVATVNGSLFSFLKQDGVTLGGMGLGYNVSDGEIVNAGQPQERAGPLPAFAITAAGQAIIGAPEIDMQLTLPGSQTVRLDRLNEVRSAGQVALYTPRLGTHTWTDNLGDEYVIDGFDLPLQPGGSYTGTVAEVRAGAGDTAIALGQVVLSVSESAAWPAALAIGDPVTLSIGAAGAWNSVHQSVSGRDMLLADGHSVVPQPNGDGRHARTAVGIRADGTILMVTADSGSYINGLSLQEAARLMLSLGAIDALNLDGGVSSQMAVRLPGDVYPSPVSTKDRPTDRPVVNALQVVSDLPDGPLDRLLLSPGKKTAAVGEVVEYTVKGQDANLNGLPIDAGGLQWDVAASGGGAAPIGTEVYPTADGASITIRRRGDYVVTVHSGSEQTTGALKVVADTVPPQVSSPVVSLTDLDSVGLSATSLDVSWAAVDNVGVSQVQVQRKIDSGRWKSVSLATEGASVASVAVGFGRRIQFRVRATDDADNTSEWAFSRVYKVTLFDEGNAALTRTGTWRRMLSDQAIGGGFVRSRTAGSAVTALISASQVAVIGNRGPAFGQADAYVNGTLVASTPLTSSSSEFRRVIYLSGALSATNKSMIRVENAGTGDASVLDLDAIIALVPVD